MNKFSLFIIFQFFILSCSGKNEINSTEDIIDSQGFIKYSSGHFIFHYTIIDKSSITDIAGYVEENNVRIMRDLKIDNISKIQIRLYPKLKELHIALGWPDALDWVRGAATSKTEIIMISPNSTEKGNASYNNILNCIVHEYAHCVTMHVNSTIANRPRWLWEGVAIYESNQFINPKTLSYMRSGAYPTLRDMSDINNTKVYEVAYTIIEYIINEWGIEKVIDLIKSNGDITNILKMTESEFEAAWYNFVKSKYKLFKGSIY